MSPLEYILLQLILQEHLPSQSKKIANALEGSIQMEGTKEGSKETEGTKEGSIETEGSKKKSIQTEGTKEGSIQMEGSDGRVRWKGQRIRLWGCKYSA